MNIHKILSDRTNRSKLIATGTLVILTLAISICSHFWLRFPGDLPLSLLLQSTLNEPLTELMKGVSFVTENWRAALLVISTGLVIWWRIGKWEAFLIAIAGVSSQFSYVFKLLVERPRPSSSLVQVLVNEAGYGFPSGHATFVAAFLGFAIYLVFTRLPRQRFSILTGTILFLLILWVGTSRIYLGVHWASDVLGGYLIGAVIVWLLAWLDRSMRYRFVRLSTFLLKNSR